MIRYDNAEMGSDHNEAIPVGGFVLVMKAVDNSFVYPMSPTRKNPVTSSAGEEKIFGGMETSILRLR